MPRANSAINALCEPVFVLFALKESWHHRNPLSVGWWVWQPGLLLKTASAGSARAGGGDVHRVEARLRIKVSEQRERPAAARQRLAAASGGSHARKAVRIRLPAKRTQ